MSKQSEMLRNELKLLQSEADKILDEIDAKEAEILQIEEVVDILIKTLKEVVRQW